MSFESIEAIVMQDVEVVAAAVLKLNQIWAPFANERRHGDGGDQEGHTNAEYPLSVFLQKFVELV